MLINLTGKKSEIMKSLISTMLDILFQIGIDLSNKTDRRLERMAEACLAVGNIRNTLSEAQSSDNGCFLKTREIIHYMNEFYGEQISSGSYDDIRRKDLIQLIEAGIIINSSTINDQATNNPTRGYALSPQFSALLKAYGTPEWSDELKNFKLNNKRSLNAIKYTEKNNFVPVKLPTGETLQLSFGEHNDLQKQVVETFLPHFGFGAKILYIGDTKNKFLYKADNELSELGVFKLEHNELPDIIAYSQEKNLLYMIEAVYSSGPMNELRVSKLKRQLTNCKADIIFVTAFLSKKDFRRWSMDIAWETEVWIAENPEHLIHFNGSKFLELHK